MKLGKWLWLLKWRITAKKNKSNTAATLGVMPDYGYKGKGMRLSSISAGKTAEKYELKEGDTVMKIDDHRVEDLFGYMSVIAKYHVGDKANILLQRGNEEVIVSVEFI